MSRENGKEIITITLPENGRITELKTVLGLMTLFLNEGKALYKYSKLNEPLADFSIYQFIADTGTGHILLQALEDKKASQHLPTSQEAREQIKIAVEKIEPDNQ